MKTGYLNKKTRERCVKQRSFLTELSAEVYKDVGEKLTWLSIARSICIKSTIGLKSNLNNKKSFILSMVFNLGEGQVHGTEKRSVVA